MKKTTKKSKFTKTQLHKDTLHRQDDFFERCLQKGLIEKTASGYYFTFEFFDLLKNRPSEYSENDKKMSEITKR